MTRKSKVEVFLNNRKVQEETYPTLGVAAAYPEQSNEILQGQSVSITVDNVKHQITPC